MAGIGIVRSGGALAPVPAGAIAVVNGRPIARESFARFAAAVAVERKVLELDEATRRRLLERMLDEELLLQRGVELGLHRVEPTARGSIVSALVTTVAADAELDEPEEAELRAFHRENEALFRLPERVWLDAAFVSTEPRPDAVARERAREIEQRLRAGESFDAVREALADAPVVVLPAGLLPLETVREYLGPTAARAAAGLEVGTVSAPVRAGAGYWVLRMRERVAGEVAPFDAMRDQVRAEVLRARGDAALREYLAELRDSADIRVVDPELAGP
jgi:parvulin-like peptidyl-prolyl isomerase